MATAALCTLLYDEQLGSDDLQEIVADDTGSRLTAYFCGRALQGKNRWLGLTVADLRGAVLQLAKQGYLDHSKDIRLSKLGGTRAPQQSSKQVPISTDGALQCLSMFPALPTVSRSVALGNTSGAISTAATVATFTPTDTFTAPSPSPASQSGPQSAAPTPRCGGGVSGKLQGAWAQGPLATMGRKKQAALDERMRGRTSILQSPAGGSWAAGSPAASVGSTGSAQTVGGGRGGRNGGSRQHNTPAACQGHGHTYGAGQDSPATGEGGGSESIGNGISGVPSGGASVAGCSPKIFADGQRHPSAAVGAPIQQVQGQGLTRQETLAQAQVGAKRIVPVPLQQQASGLERVSVGPGLLQSFSCGVLGLGPVSSGDPGGASPSVSGSLTNPWGVPPVNTSKQQQRQANQHRQQHQRQQQAGAVVAAGAAPADEGCGAAAKHPAAAADGSGDPDPSTPCSAVLSSCLAASNALATPPCSSLDPMPNNQNDPITPAAQIVPAVSNGSLSQHCSVALDSYRAQYCSPPSITSYPQGRPPVGPARPGPGPGGALTQAGESPAGCSEAVTAAGRAGSSHVGAHSAVAHGRPASLGSSWQLAHERLAHMHAWVLCAGLVACLQDEVSELLYLLACPPEVLLATELDGGDAVGAAVPSRASGAATTAAGALVADARSRPDWPLHIAVQYSCAVLSRCGGLLSGLGHRLLAAVATCATVRLAAPALAAAADAAAQRRERSLVRSRAVDALGGQRLQLVGPMLQSGNDMASGKSRSQEQQRRVSNRERCRDMFFAVIRQAAYLVSRGGDGASLPEPASGAPAGGDSSSRGCVVGAAAPLGHMLSPLTVGVSVGGGAGGSLGHANTAELLVPLRSQCLDVLQSLHPDNLPFFAELFTGCVLQAAATGESLVEGDLANLASRNPSKFQRLNQRMQQAPGQALAQHPPPSHQQPSTPSQSGGRGMRTPIVYSDSGFGATGAGGGCRSHGGAGGTPGPHSNASGHSGGLGHRGGGSNGSGLPPSCSAYGNNGAYIALTTGSGSTAGPGSTYGPDGGSGPQPRDTYGVSARCAATLQRLLYFPPPQRPYIFFLEATDSQSLVSAVSRHMAGVLQTMLLRALGAPSTATAIATHGQTNTCCSTIGPSPAIAVGPLGDHVVASGTLASYIAYLSVVHGAVRYGVALPQPDLRASKVRGSSSESQGGRAPQPFSAQQLQQSCHPPLDVLQLLRIAEERGFLVHIVPCVAQYLYIITNGARIANGTAPDGSQSLQVATADGNDTAAAGINDATAIQLPYLQAVAVHLRQLLACAALQPQQPAFCVAALCLRSAAEEALSHVAAAVTASEAAMAATTDGAAGGAAGPAVRVSATGSYNEFCFSPQRSPRVSEAGDTAGATERSVNNWVLESDARLSRSLQESDGLVDSRMLELCCPAIEAASRVLQRAAAAATKLLQQSPSAGNVNGAGPATMAEAAGYVNTVGPEPRPLMPRRVPPAALVRLGSGSASGSWAVAAAAIPESIVAVLSTPGPSPLQQALAQALLGQYSTGEHAVPMRDVVSYVTGVLAVNGAAAALELIVPQVASEHLARLADAVRPVLQERVRRWQEDEAMEAASAALAVESAGQEPTRGGIRADEANGLAAAAGSAAAAAWSSPRVLPISEAMTAAATLADTTTAAATAASLEAALPAVRRQLWENALRSLQALLPGTVPEEAVAAAAALAAQSAEVACLQRLVAHVPAAVRSHMDEQVKHIVREAVREVERQAAEARLLPRQEVAVTATNAGKNDSDTNVGGSIRGLHLTACTTATAALDVQEIATYSHDRVPATGATEHLTSQDPGPSSPCNRPLDVSKATASPLHRTRAAAAVASSPTHGSKSGPAMKASAGDDSKLEIDHTGSGCDGTDALDKEAVEAGRCLSDTLVTLARRPTDPSLDEIIQLTAKCIGRAVTLRPQLALSIGSGLGGERLKTSASLAVNMAARRLYDAMRSRAVDAGSLERVLVRCLRAAGGAATAGSAAVVAWANRPHPEPGPVLLTTQGTASPATEAGTMDNRAAIFAFLAEVSLGIVQHNSNDSHSWVDVVWQPLLAAPLERYKNDSESEDDTSPGESELGSESGLTALESGPASTGLSSAKPLATAATAISTAVAARCTALPPVLANLYHHLAAYARDVESYRMLRTLRLALQRVTMGHLTRLEGASRSS